MLKFSPTAFYQVPLGCFVVGVVVVFGVGDRSFFSLFVCGFFGLVCGEGVVGFFVFLFFLIYIFFILLFHIKAGKYYARHRKDGGDRDR